MKKTLVLLAALLVLSVALLIAFVSQPAEREKSGVYPAPSSPSPTLQAEIVETLTPSVSIEEFNSESMSDRDSDIPLSEEELRELKQRDYHEYLRYKNTLYADSELSETDRMERKKQARENVAERMLDYLAEEEAKAE